jgi:AcrR family transcriptional regulator
MGNRERIVEASLALFNERGTRSVTTNHIADHLSISPGNLYYHFRNREEIILAIFPQIAEAVRATIPVTEDEEISAADVGQYHLTGIETLWKYRFVFRDLYELLSRDPILAESFRELRLWVIGQFRILLKRLIQQGQMRPPEPPEDIDRIATNCFIIWTSWIHFVTSSRSEIDIDPVEMADGALQGFLVFSPYLESGFAEEVRSVFDERANGRTRARRRR